MTVNIKSVIKTTLVFSFCFCAAGVLLGYEYSAGHISDNVFVNGIAVLIVAGAVALIICFRRLKKSASKSETIDSSLKSSLPRNRTLLERLIRLYPAAAFIALIPIASYKVVKLGIPKVVLLIAIPCYIVLAVGFYQLLNNRSGPK